MRTPAPVRGKTLAIPSLVIALSLLCVECGRRHDTLTGPSDVAFGNGNAALLLPSDTELPAIEISTPEVFVGAGDIALCTADGNPEATARLLDAIGGTVFALGDNAYMSGTAEQVPRLL